MADTSTFVQFGWEGPTGPPGPAPTGTGLVAVVSGVPGTLPNAAGLPGQVLQLDSTPAPFWGAVPPSADATSTSNGIVRLANGLGGTATAPTVARVDGTAGVLTMGATRVDCVPGAYGWIQSFRAEAQRTDATATTVVTVPMPVSSSFAEISVKVIGRRTDLSLSDSKIWRLSRSVKNAGGLLGGFTTEGTDLVTGAGSANVVFSSVSSNALIQVQGVSGQTWTFTILVDVIAVL